MPLQEIILFVMEGVEPMQRGCAESSMYQPPCAISTMQRRVAPFSTRKTSMRLLSRLMTSSFSNCLIPSTRAITWLQTHGTSRSRRASPCTTPTSRFMRLLWRVLEFSSALSASRVVMPRMSTGAPRQHQTLPWLWMQSSTPSLSWMKSLFLFWKL